MRAFVITVKDNEHSEQAADRCIKSAARFDIEAEKFYGYNAKDDVAKIAEAEGILSIDRFRTNEYSRYPNVLAAFLSHHALWKKCNLEEKPMIIFEHDAVVVDEIPTKAPFKHVMSVGKPSYGKFNIPGTIGVGPLKSKPYFPGAHAYMIKPSGANMLIKTARQRAEPTDIFLNMYNFPWLQEYYPWPVEVIDNFSTIQYIYGSTAKHGYSENYKIV